MHASADSTIAGPPLRLPPTVGPPLAGARLGGGQRRALPLHLSRAITLAVMLSAAKHLARCPFAVGV
jgi:hypothetical protein